jgi:hypothetical protein
LTLRTAIVTGAALSSAAVAAYIWRYRPAPDSPAVIALALFAIGVSAYVYAAIQWTGADAAEDRAGLKWGLATGIAWSVEVFGGNVVVPHRLGAGIGQVAALVAFSLPIAAGLTGAVRTGRIAAAARIGFWTGAISGLVTFIAGAVACFLVLTIPGLPGIEMPHNVPQALSPEELAAFNATDYLAAAVSHLVLIGGPYCALAATAGGILGGGRLTRKQSTDIS